MSGRHRLADTAPLQRHGLLIAEGDVPFPSRRLRVPDRIVTAVLGDSAADQRVLPLLRRAVAVPMPGSDQVAAALESGSGLIWVHSPVGTAGTALAAGACEQLDVPCLLADLARIPGYAEPDQPAPTAVAVVGIVRALVLEAALAGAVLILAEAEVAAPALSVLQQAAVPVVLVGHRPWDPTWGSTLPVQVTSPRTSITHRAEIWRRFLGDEAAIPEVLSLRLSPEDIAMVAEAVLSAAPPPDGILPDLPTRIRSTARRLGRGRHAKSLSDATGASLDDLVLPDHTRAEVERMLSWARHRDEVLAQGPLQGKGGKGTGICALFSGSPGTGKTLSAHIIADTLGMDLYTVELSSIVDKYIGETEKNLEKVFGEAESLNAVLFFDEADALFGSRSEVKDAKDRYANQEVAYLLQRMEQFDGITVLATNLRGNLDPAFSRRLHFMIHFPDPDAPTRHQLWVHHLANLAGTDPQDPVDIAALAAGVELAGGEIRNIVLSAAYAAVGNGGLVGMRHVVDAALREYSKLGRRAPHLISSR